MIQRNNLKTTSIGRVLTSLFLLVFLSLHSSCWAQKSLDWSDTSFVVTLGLHDQARIWSAPTRWNAKQWSAAGGVIALTGVSFLMDEPIMAYSNESSDWARYASVMGDPITQLMYPVLAFTGGAIAGDDDWKQTGVVLAHGVLNTAVVTYAGKVIFGRERPATTQSNSEFRWFELNNEYHSFPSGHSSGIWCVATILSDRHTKVGWEPILYFGAATLVSASRVQLNEHWLSDVVFGAAIGVGVGKLMTLSRKNTKWHFWPYYDGVASGLTMQLEI